MRVFALFTQCCDGMNSVSVKKRYVMFDNTLTLHGNSQLTVVTSQPNYVYDRVTQNADTTGSLWRIPGSTLTNPHTVVVKHDLRKGKGYSYQGSSVKLSFVANDTVTNAKAQFDVGFYMNVPNGSFATSPEVSVQQAAARLIQFLRTDGVLAKLMNQEG